MVQEVRTMNKKLGSRMLMLAVSLMLFAVVQTRTQDADELLTEQELARQLLGSPWADYLSGSGLTAALRMSGASSVFANPHPLQRGPGDLVAAFPSQRFQVMVNDPAQDLFEVADFSTQSETAVAGFGNI